MIPLEDEMKRTQIYLSDAQWEQLDALSRQQDTSVAELIRRAITRVYPASRQTQFARVLDPVIGMWANHPELGSTDSYIRSLRQDDRLARLLP
ncbi:MAG: hypothetical protein B6D41_01725 [Chloroflexi bacterium UTCFX4]|jgi:predicted DNA-binding ribbon-helix-helix protein|nr:MAG: hypothetical protein B6D41_01725 [Chloroflexi bacterium UTCFX4]